LFGDRGVRAGATPFRTTGAVQRWQRSTLVDAGTEVAGSPDLQGFYSYIQCGSGRGIDPIAGNAMLLNPR
jgi:hypothetical protein